MHTASQTGTAAPARRTLGQFIGGEATHRGTRAYECVYPATGESTYEVLEADAETTDAAVRAARRALGGPWAHMTAADRGAVLRRIAERITARADEFLRAEIIDTGKPVGLAAHLDIPRGAANFSAFADLAQHLSGETLTTHTADRRGALNYSLRRPRGVIAVICPWNLPLLLLTWKVAPALACGNAVVVKPSEETPATAMLLAEVMNEAGVPPGVYNVVNGFGQGSTGEHLVRHPGVSGVTFTGETSTGTAIMKGAADGIRPVSLELGGKNAAIVFADCDLQRAVAGSARSAFLNCGQVCLGTERVYVERAVFDEFVEMLAREAAALRPGDPFDPATTLGPLISAGHREKVQRYFALARRQGARVVTGGGIPPVAERLRGGYWIEPTIWTGLEETSDILQQEIFGPCCHVAPFDEEDEAINRVNASDYGLAAAVWTENLSRAHRVAARLEVGTTWVNSWFLRDLRASFGGSKRSGIGREGGVHGLDFYTETHNVCIKL
ncbi:MAG: 2-hydroxymuconic semialdehyde dehydrogenase [Gammaproteobacteria bacterium]|nr:2-hydroxymuconic semialdehyde dehydrogenase [Gammaproteobacteria bacterium]